eukprot:04119.XXX_202511_202633_1 [CDS] Oithona nana genome sequencing.
MTLQSMDPSNFHLELEFSVSLYRSLSVLISKSSSQGSTTS